MLDILIPVYNEGNNILKVLAHLDASVKTSFRVLICYDHDEDNTLAALDRHGPFRFEIKRIKNGGRGAHGAVMTGFGASDADAVIVFPADDILNGPVIHRMVEKFKEGARIVAASRFMPGGCMKGCPPLKAFLVRSAAFTLYHIAGIPTHDPTNGFRLFSREMLREIPVESSEGFAFSLELLVKCHRKGWKVAEVPAQWIERSQGKSRFRVFKWLPIYLRWYFYAMADLALLLWVSGVFALYFFWVIFPKLKG